MLAFLTLDEFRATGWEGRNAISRSLCASLQSSVFCGSIWRPGLGPGRFIWLCSHTLAQFGADWPASYSFLRASSWSALPFFSGSGCFSPQIIPSAFHLNAYGSRNELKRFCCRVLGWNPAVKWEFDGSVCYSRLQEDSARLVREEPCPSYSRVPGPAWSVRGCWSEVLALFVLLPLSVADTRYPLANRLQGKARASSQPALFYIPGL